jgi:6-phosphogluconolactonase
MTRRPDVIVAPDARAASAPAAERLAGRVGAVSKGAFRLCLSGGSTPIPLYAMLAARHDIDWRRVLFFWGDERCVPPTDRSSNYGTARRTLLRPAAVPAEHVFRIRAESGPEKAAAAYHDMLAALPRGDGRRLFDLVLLGLGEDGHTASLFPGREPDWSEGRLAVATHGDERQGRRVTLTPEALGDTDELWVLAFGAGKADTVAVAFEAGREPVLPIERVVRRAGRVVWFLDDGSSGSLRRAKGRSTL